MTLTEATRGACKSATRATTPKRFNNSTRQMTISPITISEAKDRLPIPSLWGILNLAGDPPVKDGVYRSPFREDGNPSFSIFANGTRFKDHATGESGDAITFYAMARGIQNREALKEFLTLAAQWT